MAEAFKELFVRKCKDFACEPIKSLLEDLDKTQGECPTSLRLNGNSKRLFNNRVDQTQVFALCETLYEDVNVVALDLSYNNLSDMAAQALARLITVNSTLSVLNLSGNDITSVGATYLSEALSQSKCTLQVLLLNGNPLEDSGVVTLGNMLRSNASLRALDICGTQAGISGIISVCTALGEANSTLQLLDLGNPLVRGGPQDTTSLSISQMLARNQTLKQLGLSKHGMVDSQLDTLVTYGLLRNSSLNSLDLRANKLSAFAGPTLERLLNENRQIQDLNLANNNLGDAGALSIARSVPYSQWLHRLDLRSNGIGEQGLVALAEALTLASHLQGLLLWGNNFGPSACRAFFDTLTAIGTGSLVIDLRPYEVDGRAQVALLEIESGGAALQQSRRVEDDALPG